MNLKILSLKHVLIIFYISSCDEAKITKNNLEKSEIIVSKLSHEKIDSFEFFFQSKGVLIYAPSENHLKSTFDILNDDNSIYASINIPSNEISIKGNSFALDKFLNNEQLRNKYHFFPKEFFPEQSVIQFEFTTSKDEYLEILLDKKNNIKKKIKLNEKTFKLEYWKDHLLGCIIDFDAKSNPIRKEILGMSLDYENSGEDYIFTISKIQGDWIKIECSDICGYPCDSKIDYNGWIRWKENKKLLIRLLYSC
ncbi:MAG: hypothetical protein LCH37_07535 [Bacteroidetes bacterium]|nr:hypothetical protein [Bacteroidota bacterium]